MVNDKKIDVQRQIIINSLTLVDNSCSFSLTDAHSFTAQVGIPNCANIIKYATTDKQINVITVETTPDLSHYLLNFKRKDIAQIEKDYNVYIFIEENESIDDNNYNIKKRKGLTNDEKKDLEPQQKLGKVNLDFGDNELYSVSSAEIKKYKFDDETYGNNEKNSPKRVNRKQYNRYNRFNNNNDKNNKKTSWFKRLFGIK